jgi:glycosyltransferase involved in cell wall biosynthesis
MDSAKYKIAYFQQDGLVTGSAISLRHFLSAMNRELFEPIVVLAKEGPARKLFESLNIPVLVYEYNTFWTFPGPRCFSRGMFKQLKALMANQKLEHFVINHIKPDIIHINDKAALNVGISLKKSGIPIIQHSRSSYFITSCKWAKYISAKSIKRFANHIICISEDEEDGFDTFHSKSTIYNTVDCELIKKAKDKREQTREQLLVKKDDCLIGFAAHVTEKKGAWDFLEICTQLKYNAQLKFLLAGKLEETGNTYIGNGIMIPMSPKAYVESFIKENNLEDKLIITGFREDILELIAAMDVLVVPNKNGVLGRQPIEAQALGVAVVAQKGHTQKSNIVKDGITGYLVKNTEEAMKKIKQLLQNKDLKKLSIAAEDYAKNKFNPITNMKEIEQIYMKLIKH